MARVVLREYFEFENHDDLAALEKFVIKKREERKERKKAIKNFKPAVDYSVENPSLALTKTKEQKPKTDTAEEKLKQITTTMSPASVIHQIYPDHKFSELPKLDNKFRVELEIPGQEATFIGEG